MRTRRASDHPLGLKTKRFATKEPFEGPFGLYRSNRLPGGDCCEEAITDKTLPIEQQRQCLAPLPEHRLFSFYCQGRGRMFSRTEYSHFSFYCHGRERMFSLIEHRLFSFYCHGRGRMFSLIEHRLFSFYCQGRRRMFSRTEYSLFSFYCHGRERMFSLTEHRLFSFYCHGKECSHGQNIVSLDFVAMGAEWEKTQGLKKTAVFFGFYCFFWWGFYCFLGGFIVFLGGFIVFFRFHYVFLYYCVFKLFLTRKKKITVQQMFHLEVLLRHLSKCCGCHYGCAEQDVRFLTQHVHL